MPSSCRLRLLSIYTSGDSTMTISDVFSGLSASACECYNSWFDPKEKVDQAEQSLPNQELKIEEGIKAAPGTSVEVQTVKIPVADDVMRTEELVLDSSELAPSVPAESSDRSEDEVLEVVPNQTAAAEDISVSAEKTTVSLPTLSQVKNYLEYATAKLEDNLEVAKVYLSKAKDLIENIEDEAEQKEAIALISTFESVLVNTEASIEKVDTEDNHEPAVTSNEAHEDVELESETQSAE